MATSGYIETNHTYDSYFWLYWSQVSQSIETNSTKIRWSVGVYCGHNFYLNAIQMSSVEINGAQVYAGGTYSNFYSGDHTIASGTLDVPHNADGSKTMYVNWFWGRLYNGHYYEADGYNYTLTAIPRKSTLVGGNGTLAAQQSLTITKANAAFRHSISYSCGEASGTVTEITDAAVVTWTPPISLAEQSAGSNTVRITLSLKTYNGDTELGENTYSYDYTIPEDENTRPTATLTLAPSSELISAFDGLYIQGKTKLAIGFENVTAKYGATVSQYRATVDGKEYTGSGIVSEILSKSGEVTVTAYITDSRGISSLPITGSVTVIPYSRPSVVPISGRENVECFRCDENGIASATGEYLHIRAGRSYSPVSSGGTQKNFCLLQYRHKQADSETYSGWNVLIAKASLLSDSVDLVIADVVPNPLYSYDVQIGVSDDIGESNVLYFPIPSQDIPLHLGAGGKNVGIGRAANYANDHRVDIGWATHFEKPAEFQDDAEFIGDTSFSGDAIFTGTARFADLYIGTTRLLDLLHPVGSWYASDDPTPPDTLFGGTWEKLGEGRTLIAADGENYFVEDTGGEAEHTLTVDELPSHSHKFYSYTWYNAQGGDYPVALGVGTSPNYETKTAGGGQAHNNMPPYYATNIWRRTE